MADLFKVRALEAFRNRNADMIVVEVPELSEGLDEPVKVHFKTELTVEEHLEYMDGIGSARSSLHLMALSNALLFSLCVCDEDGKPLVEKARTVKDASGKRRDGTFLGGEPHKRNSRAGTGQAGRPARKPS